MKFWQLVHLQLNNKRQQQVNLLPWAGRHYFFTAPLANAYYMSLVCFSHNLFVVLICFLFCELNYILLCYRYWKIPIWLVVFTENFFCCHTHCNSFDTCRRPAHHGYCSYGFWNTDRNIFSAVVCVLSGFAARLQILRTWIIFHPCFHSGFCLLLNSCMYLTLSFSGCHAGIVFLCKHETCSASATNLILSKYKPLKQVFSFSC